MNRTYAVPKKGIRASIILSGQQVRAVELFLGDRARNHEGSERASDLLSSDAEFIPVRQIDSSKVFLLRRDSIMVVTIAAEDEPDIGQSELRLLDSETCTRIQIEVVLTDGSTIQGTISYMMPEARRRVQDFLNLPERIIRVRDDERIHIVSKRHIAEVQILSSAPGS
jgi:hypothetical protein